MSFSKIGPKILGRLCVACNLAIIDPPPVNLVQIFSSIIDPKIPRRSRVACNLAIIGHRPVEVPIYILVTYITHIYIRKGDLQLLH